LYQLECFAKTFTSLLRDNSAIIWNKFLSVNTMHVLLFTGARGSATSQKVADSIPDGVTGILHWHNTSGRTVVLLLTKPLTEMSTGNISWGVKMAGA